MMAWILAEWRDEDWELPREWKLLYLRCDCTNPLEHISCDEILRSLNFRLFVGIRTKEL
jgi:hypothetical protein